MNTGGIELQPGRASGTPVRFVLTALVVLGSLLAGPASVGVAAPAAVASGAPAAAASAGVRFSDGHGLHVVSARQSGPRTWRLVVRTHQLSRAVRVNILLPRGYAGTSRRYPVLYLFHGTSGGADDWIDSGRVTSATAPYRLITVLPDAGYDSNGGSWFTNWLDQDTALGRANWETFHIDQLVPWVDANLRTVRARSGRAVAGLSQGGFGSMSYAARHPDLFVAAAAFSGAPDIARNPVARTAGAGVVGAIMTGLNGVQANAPFGDPVRQAINWRGHNPASLVRNLADTDLRLWVGNGQAGPLDPPGPPDPGSSGIEAIVHASTTYFAEAADAAHVSYRLHDYGPGTHTWPYWARDLRAYLPGLARVLQRHEPRPAVVGYRSIDRRWSQWGWRVETRRPERWAWSSLSGASRSGFVLRGGPAVVGTPGVFRPGRTYRVGYRGASGPRRVTAGPHGRLRLRVAPATDGGVATVRIRRA